MLDKPPHEIENIKLSRQGLDRLDWVRERMPILQQLKTDFAKSKPFAGKRIGICLHVEAKTGIWLETLIAGGAEIAIAGSPGTTQDEVAAVLVKEYGVQVFTKRSESFEQHLEYVARVLSTGPDLIADNGADIHMLALTDADYAAQKSNIIGATEETTTGAFRLREDTDKHTFPTIVINDTRAKRIIENRYGVGQSVVDAIMRCSNLLIGGKKVTVVGYGYCGQGVARDLRGLGAHVTVVDIDPLTRLEAHIEGYATSELENALPSADIVITLTGRPGAISREHLTLLKDGVVLCNAGHFETEIDLPALRESSGQAKQIMPNIEKFILDNGKAVYLLAKGNLVNLAGGDGNPIEVMDLGLALQSLSLAYLAKNSDTLAVGPQTVPREIENDVANRTLAAWT
jgi:adenosylhomocysteinase